MMTTGPMNTTTTRSSNDIEDTNDNNDTNNTNDDNTNDDNNGDDNDEDGKVGARGSLQKMTGDFTFLQPIKNCINVFLIFFLSQGKLNLLFRKSSSKMFF